MTKSLGLNNYQDKLINNDQLKVRIEGAKGKIKEVVGNIMGDDEMNWKVISKKNVGKIKPEIGDLKDDIKKTNKA